MAQIVGVVAAQVALDEADKMLQSQSQGQSNSDDQSFSMSAPSGGMLSDPMQFVSSMLPDNLDSVMQMGSGGGGQNQSSLLDEGEDVLQQGASMAMSFVK